MRFGILGTLTVEVGGQQRRVPPGRQRSLLLLLLLHANESVSTGRLADVVWGEQQPQHEANALQGRISQLRKLLRMDGQRSVLRQQAHGYCLAAQVSSLAITLLAAMLLLVAVFAYERRRPALGIITTIPVLLVVLWTFGMMALTGIPFGPITATIAALAIGIGLPYAIHVVHRFNEDRLRHDDVADAIRSTVRHTGGAMAGSAFTTMAGFGILTTSSFMPFRQLGAVMVYAVGFSLVAATLVLPSILVLWDRWHHRGAPAEPAYGPGQTTTCRSTDAAVDACRLERVAGSDLAKASR